MQIAMRERTDVSAGVLDEISVSIATNAVAFYAQISGLAKDKIGYPIRELSTNAWDASRGRFEVFLPTALNPTFRVRDYGPGMSHHDMVNVYARLYESTKRGTNESVGGWGLGSKSPFAYLIGDSGEGHYTVTSVYDGRSKTYVLSLKSDGQPVMRLLADQASEAETGLEVTFAVARRDITEFNAKAREILWSFEPRPRVFPDPQWKEPAVKASGEGWTLYERGSVPFSAPHVRMGCVMYPFDTNQISSDFLEINDPVLFEAPIGSLKVTLSRESLAYGDQTRQTLQGLVDGFKLTFIETVQAKVDEAETYFDACRVFKEAVEDLGYLRKNALLTEASWNKLALRTNLNLPDSKIDRLGRGWNDFDRFHDISDNIAPSSITAETRIVLQHSTSYAMQRFEQAGLVGKDLLWIRCSKDDAASILTHLGDPDHIILDAFKVVKGTRIKTAIRKRRVYHIENQYKRGLQTLDIDMNAGGLYIQINDKWRSRWTNVWMSDTLGRQHRRQFESIVAEIAHLGLIPYGTSILLKTPGEPLPDGWVAFGDALVPKLKELVDPTATDQQSIRKTYQIDSMIRELHEDRLGFALAPEPVRSTIENIEQLYASIVDVQRERTQSDKAVSVLRNLGITVEQQRYSFDEASIKEQVEGMRNAHPLLRLIMDSYSYNGRTRLYHDYFELLERANAATHRE